METIRNEFAGKFKPRQEEASGKRAQMTQTYRELMDRRAKLTPLKRCVTADDVAETMMSLIQSNRFVTGEVIVIDGGFASST